MKKVIKYGAPWCSQCKLQDKEFTNNPLKCSLFKYEVDDLEETELEKLNISSIPVTILYEDDKEIKRWIGFIKSEEINKLI